MKVLAFTVVAALVAQFANADDTYDIFRDKKPTHTYDNSDGSRTYRYDTPGKTTFEKRSAESVSGEQAWKAAAAEATASLIFEGVKSAYHWWTGESDTKQPSNSQSPSWPGATSWDSITIPQSWNSITIPQSIAPAVEAEKSSLSAAKAESDALSQKKAQIEDRVTRKDAEFDRLQKWYEQGVPVQDEARYRASLAQAQQEEQEIEALIRAYNAKKKELAAKNLSK